MVFVINLPILFGKCFVVDDVFYRAHILEVMRDGSFRVQFIDYGNEELVRDVTLVRPLTPRFMNVAAQAVTAALAGKCVCSFHPIPCYPFLPHQHPK